MFQFALVEAAYAQGDGASPCAIFSHPVSKQMDEVPQKDKFEIFWT